MTILFIIFSIKYSSVAAGEVLGGCVICILCFRLGQQNASQCANLEYFGNKQARAGNYHNASFCICGMLYNVRIIVGRLLVKTQRIPSSTVWLWREGTASSWVILIGGPLRCPPVGCQRSPLRLVSGVALPFWLIIIMAFSENPGFLGWAS